MPGKSNSGSPARSHASSAPVRSLTLEFSKDADYNRIDALFDPPIKQTIDPHNYVTKRLDSAFRKAVNVGAAAFFSDEKGHVQTLTMAYRVNEGNDPPPGRSHDYTELGTSLARLPGFGSARPIVAALALREWWQNPPKGAIVAEIKKSNTASVKTYRDGLGWVPVHDGKQAARIYKAADKTLADDKDKYKDKGSVSKSALAPTATPSGWYLCGDRALAVQARVLLDIITQGGLLNKRTGIRIAVDFSALDQAGLIKNRLQALANGERSRSRLLQITGPNP